MLMATQPLGAVLSPSHGGPSSFFSSSVSLGGHWAPRRPVVPSRVSCSRIGLSTTINEEVVDNVVVDEEEQTMVQGITTVTATVTVHLKEGGSTPDKVADMVNQNWLFLDFFSSNTERHTELQLAKYSRMDDVTCSFMYEVRFTVRSSFGDIGAVQVENCFNTEVYISDIEVHLHGGHHQSSTVTFHCNSWITHNNPDDYRFFFPLKSYLPSQTPRGVKNLRKKELESIRGDGRGERKEWERVYDYDVYNDLGDPDRDAGTRRPVLGGRERPYPRRCRTGRSRCRTDPSSETPPAARDGDRGSTTTTYVPRNEAFTERKAGAFATKRALSMLSAFTTAQRVSGDRRRSFPSLAAIDALYEDGYKNQPSSSQPEADDVDGYFADMLQKQVKLLLKGEEEEFKEELRKLFKFQTPETHDKDKLAWFRDEEFARQTLAGMNPLSIQLVRDTEFPIFSKLDEETYGPGDSLITRELIEEQINGVMTAEESYLPSQTPRGVKNLRKEELKAIRGHGHGERKGWERIYDYDVYNDLGNPDKDPATRRPVLGGRERPYPRRCRTGRPRCRTDPSSESPAKDGDGIYVPRDEAFTERKAGAFTTKKALSMLSAFTTAQKVSGDRRRSFPSLAAIDALYEDGYKNQPSSSQQEADNLDGYFKDMLQKQVKLLLKGEKEEFKEELRKVFKFQTPEIHDKDKLAWFRDEEFARQTLAGMNPLSIQLVRDTEFPIFSKLDEETYGPGDSLITRELIEEQINGVMTAEEAVLKKKLFMLDYHDVFLPFVHAVRELDNTTLYASRTVFFLTEESTLRPIAIELTRPKSPNTPQWRQVYTPAGSSVTASWLWQLAKTHVLAHDTGYHQLVSHWLRTHCCVEPYVIAANRRLSQMHPIYRLLHPHFRFTMEINAQARGMLISANGIIESTFAPGKHCMELSSAIYDKFWRFDMEALPADLIRRGMAFHGEDGKLKLTIEDYPYANDGLLVWDSVKEWVSDYVNHYYPSASDIYSDEELHGWWNEVQTNGHPDKEEGWPELDCHGSLVEVLSTIIWVASGHHAAVNFGQYPYAGYFPNRPTVARRNMPTEEEHGCEGMQPTFVEDPVGVLLDTFPSQYQTTLVLPALNLLSSHSPSEEYMGTHAEAAWMADEVVRAAFGRFNERMMRIAETIDRRNRDPERRNRRGPGVVPYVLLKPSYGDPREMSSVMEMGIPNSISI